MPANRTEALQVSCRRRLQIAWRKDGNRAARVSLLGGDAVQTWAAALTSMDSTGREKSNSSSLTLSVSSM